MKPAFRLAPVVYFALLLPSLCWAASYSITDLGTLGGTLSLGTAINASGRVTGSALTTGNADSHVFLYDGTMHDLGTLGGTFSQGNSINASGHVTGSSGTGAFLYDSVHGMVDLNSLIDPSSGWSLGQGTGINDVGQITGNGSIGGQSHAFRYDGGVVDDLGTLGGISSIGYGINASGQVTGASHLAGDHFTHAFLYDATMHDLGTIGGNFSFGNAINASGQVTGSATTTGDSVEHAFLYDGTMHDLGALGGTNSIGYGINASGQVTGRADAGAFLYDSVHGMVNLNSLIDPSSGWFLVQGLGINDVGQITGWGTFGGSTERAFLLTPIVPEPSSLVLAAFGFAGLAAWGAFRRSRRAAQA